MYKITIENIEDKMVPTREYEIISETGGDDGKGKYGYVKGEKMETVTTEVYSQIVEDLTDTTLFDIISAVNQLKI